MPNRRIRRSSLFLSLHPLDFLTTVAASDDQPVRGLGFLAKLPQPFNQKEGRAKPTTRPGVRHYYEFRQMSIKNCSDGDSIFDGVRKQDYSATTRPPNIGVDSAQRSPSNWNR